MIIKRLVCILLTALITQAAIAQTLTLNDASVVNATPSRIGLNLAAWEYYGPAQQTKNLFAEVNPGMECTQTRQIQVIGQSSAPSTTGWTNADQYDTVPPNYWVNGNMTVVEASAFITSFSISGNVVTFQSVNPFVVGNTVTISELTTGTYLNGQTLTILSAGQSSTQFEANFPHANVISTADHGRANLPEYGCSSTFTSNTGPNAGGCATCVAPSYTFAPACSASLQEGDQVMMSSANCPTPESWWENGSGGVFINSGDVSNGGQLLSDTTDLCATCGSQALEANLPNSNSTATFREAYDGENDNTYVLMNGTYQLSFWAKLASGSTTLSIHGSRGASGGFSCGNYTPTLTSTWTQFTFTCTASEAAGQTPGTIQWVFTPSGIGSIYIDNLSLTKTSGQDSTNTSVIRDENVALMRTLFGTNVATTAGVGTLRFWANQNGETVANWIAPWYKRKVTAAGALYNAQPGGSAQLMFGLNEYLNLCVLLGVNPYIEVPVTLTTADAANLIEFLSAPTSTTYGALRTNSDLSQRTATWSSAFSTIYLSFCNECWNGSPFPMQSLPSRPGQPNSEVYWDYSMRATDIFASMRGDQYYPSNIQLGLNAQTAVNFSVDTAMQRTKTDYVEIENYTYGNVNQFSTDAQLWGAAMVEPYQMLTLPGEGSNFYASLQDYKNETVCGASGTAGCKINIYEWGQGTQGGTIDQTHMDYINAGAGYGVIAPFQAMLHQQLYPGQMAAQNFFEYAQYATGSSISGVNSKLWGIFVDAGGATNNVRPEFLTLSMANAAMIGPMYSCTMDSSNLYNFAGNSNNGTAASPNGSIGIEAQNNVPYVYSFCYKNGSSRAIMLVNTDIVNSHTITFAGTNTPTGTVNETTYVAPTIDSLNEAHSGTNTNTATATVVTTTGTLTSPTSVSLLPNTAISLAFSTTASTGNSTILSGSISISGSVVIH